jgi:hypothetical protein
MRIKTKLVLLALSMMGVAFQAGQCAQFLGDLIGDTLWLRGID